jgi:hypothetical protein
MFTYNYHVIASPACSSPGKAISRLHLDCFVAKDAPRNDILGNDEPSRNNI